jgi:hypothetical protein
VTGAPPRPRHNEHVNQALLPLTHTPRRFRIVAVAIAALTVTVGIATALGLTPWIFLAVYAAAWTYGLAPAIGWGRSLWTAVAVALFLSLWILLVNSYIGLRLDVAVIIALTAVVLVVLAMQFLRSTSRTSAFPRVRVLEVIAMSAPAAVSATALAAVGIVRGGQSITWAMLGDAQFNTVLSRIIEKGNGETAANTRVLSLAQGLMALVHIPGRDTVSRQALLIHDVTRQADLWILMILLGSVLAGAIAARVLRTTPWPLRYLAIVLAAVLPLTWYMTGYAMSSGFYNVSLNFLALELSMYFWTASAGKPLRGAVLQLGVATVVLGAWTPMAVIPVAFALSQTWSGIRGRSSRTEYVVWIVAGLQLAAFIAAFILPSFLSNGSVLSADGTIVQISQGTFGIVVALSILTAVAILATRASSGPTSVARHFAIGSVLLAVSSALGTAFLVFQNRHLPEPWIYYPIKFAWVSIQLMIVVIWIGACVAVARIGRRRLLAAVGVGATAVILVGILQYNPADTGGFLSKFPLLSLAKNVPPTEPALSVLAPVAGTKVFFSRYLPAEQEVFANQWQFQLTANDEFTPIRGYAYRTVDSLTEVCGAAEAWGGGVQVITRSALWAKTLNAACPNVLTAVLRDPART